MPVGKQRRKARKRRSRLDPESVRRAIYLDFEGNIGRAPVLLGVLDEPEGGIGRVKQFVIERRFDPLADATGCTSRIMEDIVVELVERAESEKRRLISWSEHDLRVIGDHCSRDTRDRFAARYRNARAFAGRWRKQVHPDASLSSRGRTNGALANYLDLIGYDVPGEFGTGMTGANLRRLSSPLSKGKGWQELTDGQRGAWLSILGHNQHDCVGMYVVCKRAAEELAHPRTTP